MDSDHRRTQTDLERAKSHISALQRSVHDLQNRLQGLDTILAVVPTGVEGWGDQIRMLGAKVGAVALASSGFDHQWKTTESEASTDETYKVDVKGGDFSTQGGFNTGAGAGFVVPNVTELDAGVGYVLLHIVRDSSTREVSGTPNIEYSETAEISTESDQYVALAVITEVDGEKIILPLEFGPINVLEDMVVVNGEFKLASLIISGMNIYDLPT